MALPWDHLLKIDYCINSLKKISLKLTCSDLRYWEFTITLWSFYYKNQPLESKFAPPLGSLNSLHKLIWKGTCEMTMSRFWIYGM
jgi:hypothetical protein